PCGSCWRILAISFLTSLVARSLSVPSSNSMLVVEIPSSMIDVMCLMLPMPATASSTLRVTCVSSSTGAAPACVTVTDTTGMSMLGDSSMPSVKKQNSPTTVSTRKSTDVGTGCVMDQAEIFRRFMPIVLLGDYRDDIAVFQEAGTASDDFFTLFQPGLDFNQVAAPGSNLDLT